MYLSIVIPLFNEAVNLLPLDQEIHTSLTDLGFTYEVIYVDDGSIDGVAEILRALAAKNPLVKVIEFSRNFGQTAAMAAGFDAAKGDVVVPLDGDRQNNPADIPRLLAKLEEGYDVVSGWRKNRQDVFLSRRLPSVIANRIISRITHVPLHDYGCSLKAYRREILDKVNMYGELHRFVPALAFQYGARVTEIPVDHRARTQGDSKYGIDRTFRVVLDLITVKFLLKYATRPLQLFGKWGLSAFLLSFLSLLLTVYMKYGEGLSMNRNPLLILSAFLFFAGIQFVGLGLLGELVTRTYHEVQNKPIYDIRKKINLD